MSAIQVYDSASILAHATFGCIGFEAEKRKLKQQMNREVMEAKHIQAQTNCSWTEALRLARSTGETP